MHNRQSAPSHTGAATDGQLLIILLLNTQLSDSGADYSAGAISPLSKGGGKFQNRRGNTPERKEGRDQIGTKEVARELTESC